MTSEPAPTWPSAGAAHQASRPQQSREVARRRAVRPERTQRAGVDAVSPVADAARFDVSLAWFAWAGAAVSLELLVEWKQAGFLAEPVRLARRLAAHLALPGPIGTLVSAPLDDPARGQEIFRTLGSSSEAHITVMRSGQQQDLTLNIAQVAQEAEGMVGQGATPPDQAQPPPAEPPDTSQ